MLKGINGEDQHDVGRFPDKTSYGSGMFYAQSERDVPKLFDDLIRVLKEKPYVESVRIALRNERLHIAIEQTGIRLPYIKKYQEQERTEIRNVVRENARLLDDLKNVVHGSKDRK
jgi:hypothetical protein